MTIAIPCGLIQPSACLAHWAQRLAATLVIDCPPPTEDRNVALLQRIAARDSVAFAEFYDLHSSLFFSLAVKILRDQKEAEDVIQEVFMQIWEKAGTFDPRLGKPLSWALAFVRNKSIDRLRSSIRRTRLADDATTESAFIQATPASGSDSAVVRENSQVVQNAVAALPAEQRQAIELAFFSGLTQAEISEKLQEPLGTIKARIRRGMLKLRDKLEGRV